MKHQSFYTTVIGGRIFEGLLSGDGPYIACGTEGVALGSCTSIELLGTDRDDGLGGTCAPAQSWWVVKYHREPRIALGGFNDAERRQLAHEFGIPLGSQSVGSEFFWKSAAFHSLALWTLKYPKIADRYRRWEAYLPGWYDAARATDIALAE